MDRKGSLGAVVCESVVVLQSLGHCRPGRIHNVNRVQPVEDSVAAHKDVMHVCGDFENGHVWARRYYLFGHPQLRVLLELDVPDGPRHVQRAVYSALPHLPPGPLNPLQLLRVVGLVLNRHLNYALVLHQYTARIPFHLISIRFRMLFHLSYIILWIIII